MSGARLALVPFVAALVIAGVTRAWFAFDGLSSQDAYAYFNFARAIGPHLWHGAPLPDLYWPRGYPIAVALLLPLTGGGSSAGQLVSALACAGAAATTTLLVRALVGRGEGGARSSVAALAAGLAVACTGATLRYSQLVMADALAVGMVAAALICAVRFANGGHGGWLVGCAVALAWGTISRWLVGLLALPLAIYLIPAVRRRPGVAVWAAVAAAAGLAILVPQLVVAHAIPQSFSQHEWVQNWSLVHAFRREFQTPEGHERYRWPIALFYFARLGWPDYFFPTLAIFVAAGLVVLARARDWPALALLAGWPAAALVFLAGIPYENPRFLLPTLPALAALAGIGFGASWDAAGVAWRRPATMAFALSLALGVAFGAREHGRQVARKNADLDLIAWTLARVPGDADLLMEGPTLAFARYGQRPAASLFALTPDEVERIARGRRPLYVLADVAALGSVGLGVSSQLNLARLRRDPGLVAIGEHPPYTLFAARGRP
jgi:4-amino-4-deoxy-L-arabinose transferase-like glycosyltransferase